MKAKIKVDNCKQCPYLEQKGLSARQVLYVPKCRQTGATLPYSLGPDKENRFAIWSGKVPQWCPMGVKA